MLYSPFEYLHAVTIYVIFEKQGPCPRHDTRAHQIARPTPKPRQDRGPEQALNRLTAEAIQTRHLKRKYQVLPDYRP